MKKRKTNTNTKIIIPTATNKRVVINLCARMNILSSFSLIYKTNRYDNIFNIFLMMLILYNVKLYLSIQISIYDKK